MISLLHPSRGRVEKAYSTYKNWFGKANGIMFGYVLSLDLNDPVHSKYTVICDHLKSTLILDNNSVVEATNKAAKESTGDILVYLSDDFDCPDDWANKIIERTKNLGDVWLLKVDDCLQDFNVPVLTIPIMSRGLYEKLGYFWHPGYKSMWVDCDLYETAKRIGAIHYAQDLKFPHHHHSLGKCENDDTYKRSEKNWNQGLAVFNERKRLNFPI